MGMVRGMVFPFTFGMVILAWRFESGSIPDSQPQRQLRAQSALSIIKSCRRESTAAHGHITSNVWISVMHWFWVNASFPPLLRGGVALHCFKWSLQQNLMVLQCFRTARHMTMLTSWHFSCLSAPAFFTSTFRLHLLKAQRIFIFEARDRFGPRDPCWLFAMMVPSFLEDWEATGHSYDKEQGRDKISFRVEGHFWNWFFMMQVHSRLETRHGPQSLVLSSILPASGASVLASETPLEIEPAGNRRGGAPQCQCVD